jgi:mRNA turnover protein 4
MPKSRRDKKISLTKVDKKVGLESKQKLVDNIRSAVDNYARIFVFKPENMRNKTLKDVREKWKHSKFFIGKNRVIAKALGNTEEEEYNENLHKISAIMRGEVGLLFTNEKTEDVLEEFQNLSSPDYARTGGICAEDLVLPEGPLPDFSHAIEPQLRALGLPTTLKKGIVTLLKEHVVCKEGDILTSEQARILKLFGNQQAEFRLLMLAVWSNDGEFKILAKLPESMETTEDQEDNQDSDGE